MADNGYVVNSPAPDFGVDGTGLIATLHWCVQNVDPNSEGITEVMDALPKFGDALPGPWTPAGWENITCKSVRPRADDESAGTVWYGEVLYGTPTGSLMLDRQSVDWAVGNITQHIDLDLNGYEIGSRLLVDASSGRQMAPPAYAVRLDEHAQFGVGIVIPSVAFDIIMPLGATWNPGIVTELDSHCNADPFTFKDQTGQYHTLNAGVCMLMGGTCSPYDYNQVRVMYHFMAATMELPENIPVKWNRGADADYSGTQNDYDGLQPLPLCFGTHTTFKPVDSSGTFDREGEVRVPRDVRVDYVYKADADFNAALGIE